MNHTKIEWVRNPDGTQGYTWNPITGCLNGCEFCYAKKLANGRLRERYLANHNYAPFKSEEEYNAKRLDPFYPHFWEDRLGDIPHDWQTLAGWQEVKSRGIIVCDMSDLFGIGIPKIWQEIIFHEIKKADQHRLYLLTKQPQNLPQWSPFPENCWVGVTATNQEMWNDALWYLTDVKASIKYISIEPHLGKIIPDIYTMKKAQLGWVIDGSQTKPYKPPRIEWVQEIVEACDKAGIPVFLKNNLKPLLKNSYGWTPALYVSARESDSKTEYLRQEMPLVR